MKRTDSPGSFDDLPQEPNLKKQRTETTDVPPTATIETNNELEKVKAQLARAKEMRDALKKKKELEEREKVFGSQKSQEKNGNKEKERDIDRKSRSRDDEKYREKDYPEKRRGDEKFSQDRERDHGRRDRDDRDYRRDSRDSRDSRNRSARDERGRDRRDDHSDKRRRDERDYKRDSRDSRDSRHKERDKRDSREKRSPPRQRAPSPPDPSWPDVYKYTYVSPIAEGVFGAVFLARDPQQKKVAIKKLKLTSSNCYDPQYKREIDVLSKCQHKNITHFIEVVTNKKNERFLVFDYYPFEFKTVVKSLNKPQIKNVMLQLLDGIGYLHEKNLIHRDLKPDNLMFDEEGILKIGDFGSSRWWVQGAKYSPGMVTLRYRAPEIFMGDTQYGTASDMWFVGCIFAELLLSRPLLDGITELEQIDRMCSVLGSPNNAVWPNFQTKYPRSGDLIFPHQPENRLKKEIPGLTDLGKDLLTALFTYNPDTRITASKASVHSYWREEPLPEPKLKIET